MIPARDSLAPGQLIPIVCKVGDFIQTRAQSRLRASDGGRRGRAARDAATQRPAGGFPCCCRVRRCGFNSGGVFGLCFSHHCRLPCRAGCRCFCSEVSRPPAARRRCCRAGISRSQPWVARLLLASPNLPEPWLIYASSSSPSWHQGVCPTSLVATDFPG